MRKLKPRVVLEFAQDPAGLLVWWGPERILPSFGCVTPTSPLSCLSPCCGIVGLTGLTLAPQKVYVPPVPDAWEGSGTANGIFCSFLLAPALGRPTCSKAVCLTLCAGGLGQKSQVQVLPGCVDVTSSLARGSSGIHHPSRLCG